MSRPIALLSTLFATLTVGCSDYEIHALGTGEPAGAAEPEVGDPWSPELSYAAPTEAPASTEDEGWTTAQVPDIALSAHLIDFSDSAETERDVRVFTITNQGDADLVVEAITWSDPGAGFSVLTPADALPTLPPGGSFPVQVAFDFDIASAPGATLQVESNDPDEPSLPVDLLGGACWDAPTDPFYAIGNASEDLRLVYWDGVSGFSHAETVGETGGGIWKRPQVGDFDQDGILEVIAVRHDADDLVHVGWGCRTYDTTTIAANAPFVPFGLGDLNADGHLDLWGRDGLNDGWVGLGRGDGTFDFAQTFDLRAINSGYVIALSQKAADIDGDGIVDLVAADYRSQSNTSSRISFLRGNGDGSFAAPVPFAELDTATNALDLADLDGDGQPEVIGGLDDDGDAGQAYRMQVTPELDATVSEYFDQNTGAERSSTSNAAGAGRVVVADWNRDGNLVVMASKDTDPYAAGMERVEVTLHALDADGGVASTESALVGSMAGNLNIGVPVW